MVVDSDESDGVVITGLSDISFWYNDAASHFNTSDTVDKMMFEVSKVQLEIDLERLAGFYTDPRKTTTVTLSNDERHIGRLDLGETGKPYAFVGRLAGDGFYGFSADACLLLDRIRSVAIKSVGEARAFVRKVQRKLKGFGYDPGAIDGIWGQYSISALRLFQRDRDLPVSGRLDEATRKALGL
jgi:hypothetical protein